MLVGIETVGRIILKSLDKAFDGYLTKSEKSHYGIAMEESTVMSW